MTRRTLLLPLTVALAAVALASCGGGSSAADRGDRLSVVTSFYPLQFATEQIGGNHVAVTGLTKPGVEPHELELTPKDVAKVSTAKVVVYEKGLQPAVDEAVKAEAAKTSLDVAPTARLDLALQPNVGETDGHDEHAADAEGHDSHDHETKAGAVDPHFWLDPIRYRAVARAIADRLSEADPAHRRAYQARAKTFEAKLTRLDQDFTKGLATCKRPELVTSHNAFGYLAQRYHLTQVGITGLTPDAEPDPAALASVSRYVKEHHVTTIYSETLASPASADTVAKETGASVKVLDPVEGLTDQSAGKDYFEVMRANLATLRSGQECS